MYAYLLLLFNICLLKKGPQDIPYSRLVLQLSILGYAIISYLLLQISTATLSALLQVATEIIIIISFVALMLSIARKPKRFMQTACTLLGTDTLISAFAMPIIATLSLDTSNILAFFAMLALMIWHWIVTAHIIRHALDKPFSFALGIAFLYIFSAFQIIRLLFPAISPAAQA